VFSAGLARSTFGPEGPSLMRTVVMRSPVPIPFSMAATSSAALLLLMLGAAAAAAPAGCVAGEQEFYVPEEVDDSAFLQAAFRINGSVIMQLPAADGALRQGSLAEIVADAASSARDSGDNETKSDGITSATTTTPAATEDSTASTTTTAKQAATVAANDTDDKPGQDGGEKRDADDDEGTMQRMDDFDKDFTLDSDNPLERWTYDHSDTGLTQVQKAQEKRKLRTSMAALAKKLGPEAEENMKFYKKDLPYTDNDLEAFTYKRKNED